MSKTDPFTIQTPATVVAVSSIYSRGYVWLRFPVLWPYQIFTMPVKTVPQEVGKGAELIVDIDPETVYWHNEVHRRVQLEIISVERNPFPRARPGDKRRQGSDS